MEAECNIAAGLECARDHKQARELLMEGLRQRVVNMCCRILHKACAGDTAGPGAASWDWPTYYENHEWLLAGAVSSLSAASACLGGSGPARVLLVAVICHGHAEQRASA